MFRVAMIQFKLCPVSAGSRVNRPRKSSTNTRRTRSAKRPLCTAVTRARSISLRQPQQPKESLLSRERERERERESNTLSYRLADFAIKRKLDLRRVVISRRGCRRDYKFRPRQCESLVVLAKIHARPWSGIIINLAPYANSST